MAKSNGISPKSRLTRAVICFLSFSLFGASNAWAWGREGHRITALIAWNRLTPAARQQVSDLLGGGGRGSVEQASTWADEVRPSRPETAPWHYVNIEISNTNYEPARDCPDSNCVIAQVQKDVRIIADRQLATPIRAEALRFLIHFIGDLHQPLHCADNHDRGGNLVKVILGGQQTNLHAVWDTEVVEALGSSEDTVAAALASKITQSDRKAWSRGTAVSWANETWAVAKRSVYGSFPGRGATDAPIVL